MNKKRIITFVLIALIVCCLFLMVSASKRNYLSLKNGDAIRVKDAWTEGENVLYRKDGETNRVAAKDVQVMLIGEPKNNMDRLFRVSCYIAQGCSIPDVLGFVAWCAWPWGVIIAFGGAIGFISFRMKQGGAALKQAPYRHEPEAAVMDMSPETDEPEKRTAEIKAPKFTTGSEKEKTGPPGIPEIEEFFLNLYRFHMGATSEDPGKIERTSVSGSGLEIVYKLHVQVNGEWKYRGMSIAPVGEDAGSKSKCYYVIFDEHLVIKIPARPIKDFSEYLRGIRYENGIVHKLTPRECIIPNLSVIMRKYRLLPDADCLSPQALEQRYVEMLESSTEYHDCLKIGGHFAFFMNLSRYYFLSHVLHRLHEAKNKIREMVISDAELLLDCQEFENKYGSRNGWICTALQKLFLRFDEGVQRIETQFNAPVRASERQKKNWLFAHLTLQDISAQGISMPDKMLTAIENLLYEVTDQETELIMTYRKLADKYAQIRLFKRTRPKLEGIITNLLELLVWMRDKGVAMRDLKPDNLFVAGDPQNYPRFLSSASEYTIGLIDLETAVDYKPADRRSAAQPSLGGTPAYATPSHYFPNKIINEIYQDLPSVFHFQDWYATIAIIYEAVIGKKLFKQTSRQIRALLKHLNKRIREKRPLKDIYQEENRLFWKSAIAEFRMNIHENGKWLKELKVVFPEAMRHQFKIHLLNEMLKTDNSVRAIVEQEAPLQEEDDGEGLVSCTYEEICQKIEDHKVSSDTASTQGYRFLAIESLENLATLKKQTVHVTELFNRVVKSPTQTLPADELLQLMFDVVLTVMYPEDRQK